LDDFRVNLVILSQSRYASLAPMAFSLVELSQIAVILRHAKSGANTPENAAKLFKIY
jgi:hypothetical protein